MIQAVILRPENVFPGEEKLRPLIEKACSGSLQKWTPDEVLQQAFEEYIQLWLAFDPAKDGEPCFAIVGTSIDEESKVLEILFAGGESMPVWLDQLEEIKAFGRLNGCKRLHFVGRVGWKRVLPSAKVIRHLYEMEL